MIKRNSSIKFLILFLLLIISIKINSQRLFTKELIWTPKDSLKDTILDDTLQIISWGLKEINFPYASYKSKSISIKENNFFILMIDICSGIYCPFINVFKKEDSHWELLTWSHANLTEQIKIEADSIQEKIIFKTKSGKIGELDVGIQKEKK